MCVCVRAGLHLGCQPNAKISAKLRSWNNQTRQTGNRSQVLQNDSAIKSLAARVWDPESPRFLHLIWARMESENNQASQNVVRSKLRVSEDQTRCQAILEHTLRRVNTLLFCPGFEICMGLLDACRSI